MQLIKGNCGESGREQGVETWQTIRNQAQLASLVFPFTPHYRGPKNGEKNSEEEELAQPPVRRPGLVLSKIDSLHLSLPISQTLLPPNLRFTRDFRT